MVGAGNVAWNLAQALRNTPHDLVQVISPTRSSAEALAAAYPGATATDMPRKVRPDLDLVFIVTNDHTIREVASAYAPYRGKDTVFVHTSGSISMDALAPLGPPYGVFYPLQTFTRAHSADFTHIPIFIEGSDVSLKIIRPVAKLLSERVRYLNTKDRLQLHLGAVFASNFVNFMLMLTEEAIEKVEGLDMSVYEPLVRESMEKAFKYGPENAQTGPALRGDAVTMDKHLSVLAQEDPERAELYKTLSMMIGSRFGDA